MKVEAERRFLVEVPDNVTEEEAKALVEEAQDSLPDSEGMDWIDGNDRGWIGFEVEIEYTGVSDPDTVAGGASTKGLRVISLDLDRPYRGC